MSQNQDDISKNTTFGSYLKKEMLDNFACTADAVNLNNHMIHHPPKELKPTDNMVKPSDPKIPKSNITRPFEDPFFGGD